MTTFAASTRTRTWKVSRAQVVFWGRRNRGMVPAQTTYIPNICQISHWYPRLLSLCGQIWMIVGRSNWDIFGAQVQTPVGLLVLRAHLDWGSKCCTNCITAVLNVISSIHNYATMMLLSCIITILPQQVHKCSYVQSVTAVLIAIDVVKTRINLNHPPNHHQ